MNTSSNFVITAILGFAIFSESLPPLWWAGASLLVAGNVIIGRKDEAERSDGAVAEAVVSDGETARVSQQPGIVPEHNGGNGDDGLKDEEDEDDDIVDLGDANLGSTLIN